MRTHYWKTKEKTVAHGSKPLEQQSLGPGPNKVCIVENSLGGKV